MEEEVKDGQADTGAADVGRRSSKGQTAVLLAVVVLAYMGQMMLNPIISPLARSIGMGEWHVGAIISTAAITLMLLSQFWGRRAQKWGPKRPLLFAMLLGFIALGGFALVALAGDRGLLAGGWLVAASILTRGVLYGAAISAVIPAGQFYLVATSETEAERTRAVGALGAASG